MPKHRRLKHMEDPNDASGKDPEYGAIFMSSISTAKECFKRNLFGLPIGQAGFVKQVKDGMMLFLFEFESRELHGVFQACSDGAINIVPDAFHSSGKQFPAQVKFIEKWHCRPLYESEFRHAIRDNYFSTKKFNFGLSKNQVQRLLKLFSLNKVERSLLRETAASKSTRKSESNLGSTDGDRGFRNHYSGETDRDIDREIPVGVTYEGDLRGRRLSRGIKYSRDTSDVCRRLIDSKMHGSEDRVGYVFSMSNSFGTDALTNDSDYSLVNDSRVSNNVRHTASGRLDYEYYEKDGIRQPTLWSNDKEHLNFEAGSGQSSVRQDLLYGANRGYYDHCDPGIMGDAAMKHSRHDLGAPNVDLIGSSSFAVNTNNGLREEVMSGGHYVNEAFFSETLQAFPDEHNGIRIANTSSPGEDYYIPMPIEYHTNSAMIGVSESESGNGHLHYSQYPGLPTAARDTENRRNLETLSHSGHNIYPSFAYPSASKDLSPNSKINNGIPEYQHQEEFGGQVSDPNDIYPSFTYRSMSAGGVDFLPENRTQNEGQAYQQDEKLSRDDFNSNNRVLQMTDDVKPAERKRKSVFSRLAMPSEKRDAEKETSPDSESVDEVLSYLDNLHKHWMEQKRPNIISSDDSGIPKKKKEKFHTAEVLDNDLALSLCETTPNDVLHCEESMEHCAQKLPFIDFKRRSKSQKSSGNSTQGCQDIPNHSAPQNKRRKLLRPKLILDNSQKDRGITDGPIENILAPQAVNEVPVNDFRGRNDDDPEKNIKNNDDPVKKVLSSQSAPEVPIRDLRGGDEDDTEKNLTNNDDPVKIVLASQSATEVPLHDFRGGDEDASEKNIRNIDDSTINVLASCSATEVPILHLCVRDEDDSEKNLTNNEDPFKNVLASQSATEVLFRGCGEDDSEKNIRNKSDPIKLVLASQSATEVPFHDFLGRVEDDSEKDRGNKEKDRGNNDGHIGNMMASQSATEVPFHDFFAPDRQ